MHLNRYPKSFKTAKGIKYAAALRYRPDQNYAPVIVASGRGIMAESIIQLAQEAGVPNHVEPELAKILAQLEPGTPIPKETYRLVAEILAFIWSVDRQLDETKV
jgi:flagellar biosynthesis protein